MKYTLALIALAAAVVTLFVRPPRLGQPPSVDVRPRAAPSDQALAAEPPPRRSRAGESIARPRGVVVYVAGEVRRPGVYTMTNGGRANDALARAGGPLADADLVAVNLAAPLADGDEIAVPKLGAARSRPRGAPVRVPHRTHHPKRRQQRGGDESGAAPATPLASIDLNAADAAALEAVPGIGKALAERIVAYREENGRFATLDELADVAGITERAQDQLEQYVFVR